MKVNTEKQKIVEPFLKEFLRYDSENGTLTWIQRPCKWSAIKPNSPAGRVSTAGYREIKFMTYFFPAHRICWFLYYEKWPEQQIDHINRDKLDNRINNLRDVSSIENMRNRPDWKGKFHGVYYLPRIKKYSARGYKKYLGVFKTREEAAQAVSKYEQGETK